MRAIVVNRPQDVPAFVSLENDLPESFLGDEGVLVDVSYSSINYKDGLALTGKPGIIRAQRLIPGIDLVGTLSSPEALEGGTAVLVNGCGIGETHNGGLAERARVDPSWLVPVPANMTPQQAAAVGTAGYTAMLAVLALERAGVEGDVLVTGAGGGLGSIAVMLLAARGYRVTASTGRAAEHDYLRSLGAVDVIDRNDLSAPGKPMQSERWDGAVDSVGGSTLANVLSQTRYGGTVAACGMAQSTDLPASVLPFILRGVTLAGINSVLTPRALRLEAWEKLGAELDLDRLDAMTSVVPLDGAIDAGERILAGTVRGRTVVDVQN